MMDAVVNSLACLLHNRTPMRYLTTSEAIYINGRLLNDARLLAGTRQVRDFALLDAAIARPAASAFGGDAYPTLEEKVAALFHSLLRNHPFTNGNKRTATVATVFMFRVNGKRVIWAPDEALGIILALAADRYPIDRLAAWFPLEPVEPSPEPDAEADMRLIEDILREQEWLLDELAGL
jgi:death-on-curing protein